MDDSFAVRGSGKNDLTPDEARSVSAAAARGFQDQ
jgi:hypothetical protein